MLKFYVKVFYVMSKALSGELSCPCDRSCVYHGRYEVVLESLRKKFHTCRFGIIQSGFLPVKHRLKCICLNKYC